VDVVSIALHEFTKLPTGKLVPAPWNANEVPKQTLSKIRKSLETYGILENSVVRPDWCVGARTREEVAQRREMQIGEPRIFEVLSGNHRLLIYRDAGVQLVPCMIVELPDDLAKIAAQVLNRTRGAKDNPEKLDKLLRSILETKSAADIASLLPQSEKDLLKLLGNKDADDDAGSSGDDAGAGADPNANAVSKVGEVYQLGPHRLACGDCTVPAHRELLMQGRTAKLGLHDPPYGIAIVEAGLADGNRHGNAWASRMQAVAPIANDDRPFDPTHLLGTADTVVLWGANHYADKLPRSAAWLMWDKRVDLPSNGFSDGELAWVSRGGSVRIIRHVWNGLIRASERGEARVHPTQKAVAVLVEVLGMYTQPGDLVTDWYAGSGSTLIACAKADRVCFTMELMPYYCDVVRKRWTKWARENNRDPGSGGLE
jgi:hypothetical protein